MDAPVTMSYLSDDGSYVLYQNSEPVGKQNVLRIDGYGTWHTLDMDQISSMLMDRPFPIAVPL